MNPINNTFSTLLSHALVGEPENNKNVQFEKKSEPLVPPRPDAPRSVPHANSLLASSLSMKIEKNEAGKKVSNRRENQEILKSSRHDPDAAWQKNLYTVPFFTADGQKAKVVGEYMKGDSLRFEVKNKAGDTCAVLKRTHLDNGEQVWMLPKHASISGGAPTSSGSTPIMSISLNAWNKINHLDESIVTNIAHQLDNEGVGHVVWGSKPVQLLEGVDEEGIWHDMSLLAQDSQLKDNFHLLPISSNSQKPPEEQEGYLVNRGNLLRVIEQEKAFFAQKFGVSDLSSSTAMLDECVIPHLQRLSSSEFNNDQEFLATVLGFGRSNAQAVIDTDQAPAYTEGVNQQVEAWMIARAAEKDISYPIPKLPPFKKLPSAESQGLVNQYLKDSDEIHSNIAGLIEKHSNLADDENIELSDARIFVAALLTMLER